jgi:hypothetical protein
MSNFVFTLISYGKAKNFRAVTEQLKMEELLSNSDLSSYFTVSEVKAPRRFRSLRSTPMYVAALYDVEKQKMKTCGKILSSSIIIKHNY